MKLVFDEKCIVIWAALSTCIQSIFDQGCPENLMSTVVYEGDSASFRRVNDGQPVQWEFLSSSDSFSLLQTITNYDDVVVSQFSSAYGVLRWGLAILNSTVAPLGSMSYSTAGLYFLSYGRSNCSTAANLIVISSGPYCSLNASDPANVTLSCSVDFAASSFQPNYPILTWKNGISDLQQQQPISSQITSTLSGLNRSETRIRIDSNDATRYECQLTFSPTSQYPLDYMTTTPPNFTASCFVSRCSANLTNIVVYEGSRASFKRLNNSQRVQWQMISSFDPSNTLLKITNYDDVVDDTFSFSLSYASTPTELTIFHATVNPPATYLPYTTAGLYVLRYETSSCIFAANLIVIRYGPLCLLNASDPANVMLSCRVDFAASRVQPNYPIFTWKNGISVVQQQQPTPLQLPHFLSRAESQIRIDSNDATRYECQLTFSPTSQYPLDYVTTTPPNFTASCFVSTSDISSNPTFGPVAGGTVLTIVTNWTPQPQVVSVSAVYIGVNLTAEIYNSSGNTVLVKTPTIESEILINQPLPVFLGISPISTNISTGKYFTYKPNPRIDDVSPRELSTTGGTTLRISGYSLDSAAYPLVRAAVIITNGSTITYFNVSYGPCHQPTENGTKMVCTSPPIYIRQDFLMYLYDQANQNTSVYVRRKRASSFIYAWQSEDRAVLKSVTFSEVRSKRSVSVKSITTNQSYTLPNSQDQMVIYLGTVFDDYKRYENNSLMDSSGTFQLKYPPNISCASDIQYADSVTIEGDGFTQCCTNDDYTIRIGNGFCNVTSLTDNALACNPPKDKPHQTDADKLYCGDNFVLLVELKIKTWKCSCLKYPDGNSTKLIIIVVTTVGSTLVLIVAIAVILTIIKRKQKTKSSTDRELRSTQRSTLYAPQNNIVQGTTENNGSAYYSSQIQAAYLELDPETSGQSNKEPIEGGGYLRPTEFDC